MAVEYEEVLEYLESQQIEIPESLVRRLIRRVESKQDCFDKNGYTEDDVYFITIYLVAMLALFSADGRIKSQSAPSGASRSFDFGTLGERWKALSSAIRLADPKGCVLDLTPANPDAKNCALFISPGVGRGRQRCLGDE